MHSSHNRNRWKCQRTTQHIVGEEENTFIYELPQGLGPSKALRKNLLSYKMHHRIFKPDQMLGAHVQQ